MLQTRSQEWSHLNLLWQSYVPEKKCSIKNQSKGNNLKTEQGSYGFCALNFESMPETCIPSLESFKHMVAILRSGQEMLDKNQRGLIKKWNKVELQFLYTALHFIATNIHTKVEVIWTYGDKVKGITHGGSISILI